MYMKICKICCQNLTFDNYHKNKLAKDGLDNRCKYCCKQYKKQHRLDNLSTYKQKRKAAHEKIKDDIEFKKSKAIYDKLYALKNKSKIRMRDKIYRQKTKDKRNAINRVRLQNKRKNDLLFKLKTNISNYIRDCLKSKKMGRSYKQFISYEIIDLIKHLESKFTSGMTWENYGEWHIDHIIPVSSFDFNNETEIITCWSLENLQPLWATTEIAMSYGEDETYIGNIEKGNKVLY